jgi:hypothetical protein
VASIILKLYYSILTLNYSARTQCGPKDIGVGDIVLIDFSILVVNGKHNNEKVLRMICILRGIHIIKKRVQADVSVNQ